MNMAEGLKIKRIQLVIMAAAFTVMLFAARAAAADELDDVIDDLIAFRKEQQKIDKHEVASAEERDASTEDIAATTEEPSKDEKRKFVPLHQKRIAAGRARLIPLGALSTGAVFPSNFSAPLRKK